MPAQSETAVSHAPSAPLPEGLSDATWQAAEEESRPEPEKRAEDPAPMQDPVPEPVPEPMDVADRSEPSAFTHGFERLSDQISQLDYTLGEFMGSLDRPPNPGAEEAVDPAAQQDMVDRVTAAVEQVGQRQTDTTESLEKQLAELSTQLQAHITAVEQANQAPDPAAGDDPHEKMLHNIEARLATLPASADITNPLEERLAHLQDRLETHIASIQDTKASAAEKLARDTNKIEAALRAIKTQLATPAEPAKPAIDLNEKLAELQSQLNTHMATLEMVLDGGPSEDRNASIEAERLEGMWRAIEARLAEPPAAAQIPSMLEDRLEQMQDRIAARFTALEEAMANPSGQAHTDRIEAALRAVEARLATPPPAPDLAPQREVLARFTTAMENVGQRHRETTSTLEGQIAQLHDQLAAHMEAVEDRLTPPVEETPSPLEAQIVQLQAQLANHMTSIEDKLASAPEVPGADRIEAALNAVESRLAAPAPALDLAPQREMLARFTTAMENVGQRHADTTSTLEAQMAELRAQIMAQITSVEAKLTPSDEESPSTLDTQMSEMQEHLASLMAHLAEGNPGTERLEDILRAVETRLATPPPAPELAPQREMLARFTTAMETIGQRHAETTSAVEGQIADLRDQLSSHIASMDEKLTPPAEDATGDQLEDILKAVEARLALPPPAPELAPQREMLARFTTAMEHVGQRHADTTSTLEAQMAELRDQLTTHIASVEDKLAAPVETPNDQLEDILKAVEARLALPPPAPEMAPQREMLARFTTAMETVTRRYDAAMAEWDTRLTQVLAQVEQHGTLLESSTQEFRLTQGATSQNVLHLDQQHGQLRDAIESYAAAMDPAAIAAMVLDALQDSDALSEGPERGIPAQPEIAETLIRSFRLTAGEAIAQAYRAHSIGR